MASPQPWNLQIGQEVHRVVLFNVFLLQVLAVRHVPYMGEDLLDVCWKLLIVCCGALSDACL